MKNQIMMIILLAITLVACTPVASNTLTDDGFISPTSTVIPTDTPAPTLPVMLATPLPTLPLVPDYVLTPNTIQVARWKEYEAKLTKCAFEYKGPCTYSGPAPEPAYVDPTICEWDILGQSNQEVYLWVVCLSDSTSDRPLVVYLNSDGSIQTVKFDGFKGTDANLRLFPANVQEKMKWYYFGQSFFYGRVNQMNAHLQYRRKHPDEPPLIILGATPQP